MAPPASGEDPPATPGLKALVRHRVFLALWSAFLLSTVGSFLLLLTLSAVLYQQTSSAVLAGSVFAAQWAAPLVFARGLHRVSARPDTRRCLVVAELAGASASLALVFAVHHGLTVAAIALLLLRGFADSVAKTLRLIVVRGALPHPLVAPAGAVLSTSYFVGSGVGGLLGALLIGVGDVRLLGAIDAGTYLGAVACYVTVWSRLPASGVRTPRQPGPRGLRALPADLRRLILLSATNVSLLQGLHIVGRAALPLDYWGTGTLGVALTQAVACVALFAGALCAGTLATRGAHDRLPRWLMAASALVGSLLAVVPTQSIALLIYFTFLFLFEAAYGLLVGRILARAPADAPGSTLATSEICHTVGILTGILLTGAVTDALSIRAAPLFASAGILLALAVAAAVARRHREPQLTNALPVQ